MQDMRKYGSLIL
jgi:NADH-ubiquinone oxidoreductase chain 5